MRCLNSRATFPFELDGLLGFVIHYYQSILERLKKEPLELQPAEKAAVEAASLIDWVDKLIRDLPSLLPPAQLPKDRHDVRMEMVTTLRTIQRMAENRAIISRDALEVFGCKSVSRLSHPERLRAARRFAIGHLALGIEGLTGGRNSEIVCALAYALFGYGETLDGKTLDKYRATAAVSAKTITAHGCRPLCFWTCRWARRLLWLPARFLCHLTGPPRGSAPPPR